MQPASGPESSSTTLPLRAPALLAGAIAIMACESPEASAPPFTPQYTTEHLRIGKEFDTAMCKGQVALWETQVDQISRHLGVARDYVWIDLFGDTGPLADTCHLSPDLGQVGGCWNGSVIYATTNSVAHELVHAWTDATNPDPLPILREGLAVRMSGAVTRWTGPSYTTQDMLMSDLSTFEYGRAGHLVAWLMATYGAGRFMDLYAHASRGTSEAKISAAMSEAFGRDLKAVLADFEGAQDTYYPAMGSQACGAGEEIAWEGSAANWSASGSCLNGPFLGYEPDTWQRVAVKIPSTGKFVLDTGGRPAAMTRCLTAPIHESDLAPSDFPIVDDWANREPFEGRLWSYGNDEGESWADLPLALEAGLFEIWIDRNRDDAIIIPSELSLRIIQ